MRPITSPGESPVGNGHAPGLAPEFDDAFRARLIELLAWRRDVRRFRPEALPPGTLERLIETACLAPSVGLSQPWRFVTVADAARREAVREEFRSCNAQALASYEGDRASRYAALKLEGLREAPQQFAVFCDCTTAVGHGLGRRTMPEMAEYSVVAAICTLWLAARAPKASAWAGSRSSSRPAWRPCWTCRRTGVSSAISASAIRSARTTGPSSSALAGSAAARRRAACWRAEKFLPRATA